MRYQFLTYLGFSVDFNIASLVSVGKSLRGKIGVVVIGLSGVADMARKDWGGRFVVLIGVADTARKDRGGRL